MERTREGKTITIEIYWDDLTEKAQADIRAALHMDSDDDGNWTYFPMATMMIEDEDDE